MLPEGIVDVDGVEAEAEVATMHHQPTNFSPIELQVTPNSLPIFHNIKSLHWHIFIHIVSQLTPIPLHITFPLFHV